MSYSVGPTSLDPHKSTSAGNNTYMWMMYDRLTEIANDLSVKPQLATKWAYAADGKSFDMTLRSGVTFHDGTPFNADAVIGSINRAKTTEKSAVAASLAGVASVEKVSDTEVKFVLPDAKPSNLPQLLAGDAGVMISPKFLANETDLATGFADIGAGPYSPTDFKPGQSVTYERAKNFWDPGRALAAKFTIQFADPAARINGVQSGTFDMGQAAASDAAQAIELGKGGAFDYVPYVINTVYGALFNPTKGDLANPMIRQAIQYATDQDAMNAGIFDSTCEVRTQPFPATSKFFFPEIEKRYPFDLAKAKDLIQQSGIANPSFDIEVSSGSYEPFAQVMQQQMKDAGITMNIVTTDTNAVPPDFITGKASAIYLVVLGAADLASLWANWFGGPFGNLVPKGTPEGDAIRAEAATADNAALSEADQLKAWDKVYTDINELATFDPGCAAAQVWMSKNLVGIKEMPYIWSGAVVPYTIGKKKG
jgi:peptide/nickel transport system substrate-binding protein